MYYDIQVVLDTSKFHLIGGWFLSTQNSMQCLGILKPLIIDKWNFVV